MCLVKNELCHYESLYSPFCVAFFAYFNLTLCSVLCSTKNNPLIHSLTGEKRKRKKRKWIKKASCSLRWFISFFQSEWNQMEFWHLFQKCWKHVCIPTSQEGNKTNKSDWNYSENVEKKDHLHFNGSAYIKLHRKQKKQLNFIFQFSSHFI